jgi:hypothetical protein
MIRRSGDPILFFMSAQGFRNIFALHPYSRQVFEYCLSMHALPPRITTLISHLASRLAMSNFRFLKSRPAAGGILKSKSLQNRFLKVL